VPVPPVLPERPRRAPEAVLAEAPATFLELMAASGTRDGREVVAELDRLYETGRLIRLDDGRYALTK